MNVYQLFIRFDDEIFFFKDYCTSKIQQKTLNNDIALIKLSSPISFPSNNKIAPVCLPESGNDFTGEDAIVTGWGTTKYGQFFYN